VSKTGIKVCFPPEWDSRLRKVAEERGTPVAVVVRRAVEQYLEKLDPTPGDSLPKDPSQKDPEAAAPSTPKPSMETSQPEAGNQPPEGLPNPATILVGTPPRAIPLTVDMEATLRDLVERVAALESKDPKTP